MKRKLIALVAAAAALALSAAALTGCGGSASSDTEEFDGKLVLGFDSGYPPYGFIGEDGSYEGIDIDLATEVCERNGWELELTPIDWDAKDEMLNQGSITCIWNGFTYEGREDDYAWSDRYMLNEQVIVVRSDSGITTTADLAGKNVLTQIDSAAYDVLMPDGEPGELASTFTLSTIDTYTNAFLQLESGLVDAVACDLSIANYNMAAKEGVYSNIETLSSESYAVGFAKGNEELADQVSATLAEMTADGTVEQICEKWSAYGVSFDNWLISA